MHERIRWGIVGPGKIAHHFVKDLQLIFDYADAQALVYSSFASQSNMPATISASEGRFTIAPLWHETDSYTLYRNHDPVEQRFERPRTGTGFYHEIRECHDCIRRGVIESEYWSHRNSLELISIVDRVRQIVGLEYPAK